MRRAGSLVLLLVAVVAGIWLLRRERPAARSAAAPAPSPTASSPAAAAPATAPRGAAPATVSTTTPPVRRTLDHVRLAQLQKLAIAIREKGGAAFAGDDPIRLMHEKFESGADAYDHGQYDVAAALFLEAYDLRPGAALLFNAAVSFEKLGDKCRAGELFERYLDSVPEAKDLEDTVERARKDAAGCPAGP